MELGWLIQAEGREMADFSKPLEASVLAYLNRIPGRDIWALKTFFLHTQSSMAGKDYKDKSCPFFLTNINIERAKGQEFLLI